MRWIALVSLSLSLVSVAVAGNRELGPGRPEKMPRPWPPNVPAAGRQGGDTFADAVPIVAVPYQTTGTTTGFNDDYDEVCPYANSVAPDVVYAFTPPESMRVDIDMLGSAYDTKIYLYDHDLNLVACNDDFYADYVSRLEAVAVAPALAPYYLVIDGYGEEHGDYALALSEFVPCDIDVWCTYDEGEPPLHDDYEDTYNGGCNTDPIDPAIQSLGEQNAFCGRAGWYLYQGAEYRDTDWFILNLGSDGTAIIRIDAEVETYLYELGPQDCYEVGVLQSVLAGPCSPATMEITGPPDSSVWVWVGSATYAPPGGFEGQEYDYVLEIDAYAMPHLHLDAADDYTFDAPRLMHSSVALTVAADSTSHDDADLALLCDGPPTPGPDLLASLYLAAGDEVSGLIYPFVILKGATGSPRRLQQLCLSVVSDLRDPQGTCLGYRCTRSHNIWLTLDTPTVSGWYYLVADRLEAEPLPSALAWIWHSNTPPPPPPAGDACADAPLIPPGPIVIWADLSDARDTVDPGRDGCLDAPGIHYTGRDLLYRIDFQPGQTLDLVMLGQGGWEEALYLVRDCDNPLGNCVAAGTPEGEGVHLTYTALEDETLWLVCDSWGVGPRPFGLAGSLDDLTTTPPLAPAQLALRAAPNPFNPQTVIEYDLPRAAHARLRVHDLRGRLVATLVDQQQTAGRHAATWRATGPRAAVLPSGAYLLRLEAGGEVRTARVTVLK